MPDYEVCQRDGCSCGIVDHSRMAQLILVQSMYQQKGRCPDGAKLGDELGKRTAVEARSVHIDDLMARQRLRIAPCDTEKPIAHDPLRVDVILDKKDVARSTGGNVYI